MSEQSPEIYAGNKFYDLLVTSMDRTQMAWMVGDYYTVATILLRIYNWLNGHRQNPELKEKLEKIQDDANSIKNMNAPQFAQKKYYLMRKIEKELTNAEATLYSDFKEFIVRSIGTDEDFELTKEHFKK